MGLSLLIYSFTLFDHIEEGGSVDGLYFMEKTVMCFESAETRQPSSVPVLFPLKQYFILSETAVIILAKRHCSLQKLSMLCL